MTKIVTGLTELQEVECTRVLTFFTSWSSSWRQLGFEGWSCSAEQVPSCDA